MEQLQMGLMVETLELMDLMVQQLRRLVVMEPLDLVELAVEAAAVAA
jgi:hypothetical protein